MLSKEMYSVLSCFPRKLGKSIKYENLISICELSEVDIMECLTETEFPEWNYVRHSSAGWREGSEWYLTESGLSIIEEHEQCLLNQKISKRTLWVSIIAATTSFLSVIVTLISLLIK